MSTLMFVLLIASNQRDLIGIMGAMEVELEFISSDMMIERVDTIGASAYKI